jgi:hypothetical protein
MTTAQTAYENEVALGNAMKTLMANMAHIQGILDTATTNGEPVALGFGIEFEKLQKQVAATEAARIENSGCARFLRSQGITRTN